MIDTGCKKHLLALALGGLAGTQALAQVALEEVVVTASKRGASSVQDIPTNISAIGGALLQQTHAMGIQDMARFIPGLSAVNNGPGNEQIIIRGLASSAGAAQVGTYFDEIPATGNGGTNVSQTDLQLYDLERVEVLRGPQGTLYGAGSQGGTLRYITNKPVLTEVEGAIQADMGTRSRDGGESYAVNGMLNMPVLDDRLGFRAVGFYRDSDGYVDLPDLGESGTDTEETYGGRLLGTLLLGDRTTLNASVWYQNTEVDDQPLVNEYEDSRPGQVKLPFQDELKMYNLTLDHSLAFGDITATASYYDRDTFFVFDVSQFVPAPGSVNQNRANEQLSAELRFASNFDGPLQMIVGAFYQERDTSSTSIGYFVDTDTGLVPSSPTSFFDNRAETEFSNEALFGEFTYQVTDKLELLAGVRAFRIDTWSQANEVETPFGEPVGLKEPLDSEGDDVIYKFQASYRFTDDILTYLVYSEGFREGDANVINLKTAGGAPVPGGYAPDFVDNIEFGWKSDWLDGQLRLNGAVYAMQWQDIQVALLDQTQAFEYIINAGEAELLGVELESVIRPRALPGFTVRLNANYSEQELTEDTPGYTAGDMTAGRDGDRLPDTSPFSAGVVLEQQFDLGGYDAYASVDASYVGTALTTFSKRSADAREYGDYVLAGARLGMYLDNWEAALYVTNIADVREPVNWEVEAREGIPDRIYSTQPRTVGVSVNYTF
ncbi:TonB-dependent receptor [Parahaliea mediterranea]|uniref:TonB-dependent receptor n=1 Tax=Parahaliea mediterranea TaxID=651086 RepID=A0A939IJJ2_9GAMM|nr:TonB-dependent receptor [Parahaliea mediterranea]MBN7796351.1 TonB-dependent receptor [Parahaliea mediterranea]